jgi:PKD repeat protein
MTKYIAHMFVLATAITTAGCTLANVDPPPMSGPSELSLSLTITANPDILSLDGASQTLVTVEARDVNGQLVPNVPLRVEILADGQLVDFGTLSARTLVTGSNGRASFTYTAPSFVSGPIPNIQLSVTPTGSDASSHLRRLLTVRLVPPGGINTSPTARFTVIPASPAAFTDVRFDGSTSTGGLGAIITSWAWDFGDGTTGTGVTPTHQYDEVGTFLVRLRVTDSNGQTNETAPTPITVSGGEPPTAQFLFSPTAPTAGQTVFFNATQSTAGTGHRIVSYRWNWGDGTPGRTGSTTSHSFTAPGTYVVVLTVTDEAGQIDTESVEVTVS